MGERRQSSLKRLALRPVQRLPARELLPLDGDRGWSPPSVVNQNAAPTASATVNVGRCSSAGRSGRTRCLLHYDGAVEFADVILDEPTPSGALPVDGIRCGRIYALLGRASARQGGVRCRPRRRSTVAIGRQRAGGVGTSYNV
ncbi:hypothetical protein C9J85_10725 [Haloferax sp. wsp5]|nr:hypothetical protein C9J85_10725 [Haloferax sp. wsp5]